MALWVTLPGPGPGICPAILRGHSPSGVIGAPLWVWNLPATFLPDSPFCCVGHNPRDKVACRCGSGGDGGQILASRAHSFYLLSLGYSTAGSFPKCPLGVEDSRAESPQLHGPSLPSPSSPRGAAAGSAAQPGPHVHVQDLQSERGGEAATSAPWSPMGRSWGCGCASPRVRRRGLRDLLAHQERLAHEPLAVIRAQTLLIAHRPPENQVSENSIRKGH